MAALGLGRVALEGPAHASDQPRYGGELTFAVAVEATSYDGLGSGSGAGSFALIHRFAPFYSLLVRVDPDDPNRIVGDLAERWTISRDGLTYTFTVRSGVRFHDGSALTSRDVKATYDRLISPPPGVPSPRGPQYAVVEAIEAPDGRTVRFRLKQPSASFLASLAAPSNFIQKADILARDPHWYETNVMGSGPFVFVEHVRGSHLVGRRNRDYWDKGKPYLDGFRALSIPDNAMRMAALRSERVLAEFRGISPTDRDVLVAALGPRLVIQESPWNCGIRVVINHEKRPFDDRRVRRALTLALDRYEAASVLPRISVLKHIGGVLLEGTPLATPGDELAKLAGYGRDIAASRAEARRLLAEAGAEGLAFTFTNRAVREPYETVGIWLLDQWRKVGLSVKQDVLESAIYSEVMANGGYQLGVDLDCGQNVEPDLDLHQFLSVDREPRNAGRYVDRTLDELYDKQSRALDPEDRKRYIRQFERRLLDEEAHYLTILQYHRIVAHSAKLKGWKISPSHYLNQQLDTVWLAE